jgi:Cu/Ag efflux pump CusA
VPRPIATNPDDFSRYHGRTFADGLEAGSEAYAPLARVIIGGLLTSVILTVFVVPAAYLWIYERRERPQPA